MSWTQSNFSGNHGGNFESSCREGSKQSDEMGQPLKQTKFALLQLQKSLVKGSFCLYG